jgi:hypothetical protein
LIRQKSRVVAVEEGSESGADAAERDDNSCTHMVVMLNEHTFSDGEETANMVRDGLNAGINILLVHEQDESRCARPFSHFFETTPAYLIEHPYKLFHKSIAVPWYGDPELRAVSECHVMRNMKAKFATKLEIATTKIKQAATNEAREVAERAQSTFEGIARARRTSVGWAAARKSSLFLGRQSSSSNSFAEGDAPATAGARFSCVVKAARGMSAASAAAGAPGRLTMPSMSFGKSRSSFGEEASISEDESAPSARRSRWSMLRERSKNVPERDAAAGEARSRARTTENPAPAAPTGARIRNLVSAARCTPARASSASLLARRTLPPRFSSADEGSPAPGRLSRWSVLRDRSKTVPERDATASPVRLRAAQSRDILLETAPRRKQSVEHL